MTSPVSPVLPFSLLDLAPVTQGSTPAISFHRSLELAQMAERKGFNRYWVAEHHGMPGIASAATSVLIGYLAGGTKQIRIGAGGIMLPNHAPLAIAEQFGTLASLYPGRIDLGLGRAPGSDQVTARALRRTLDSDPEQFPRDVLELQAYFAGDSRLSVQAVPGANLEVPLWILGSSLFGAQLAAQLGLPFAFASHFAPAMMMRAIALYRERFQPSEQLAQPYVMLGYNVFSGENDAEGELLATSLEQAFVNLRRGTPGLLLPPYANYRSTLDDSARQMLDQALACTAAGSALTVCEKIRAFLKQTHADELMLTGQIFDHPSRLRSFERIADQWRETAG